MSEHTGNQMETPKFYYGYFKFVQIINGKYSKN